MARLHPPYPLLDFSGGLNNKDDADLIADNQLADVQNAVLGVGFISKRDGYAKHTPTQLTQSGNPVSIGTLHDFIRSDGNRDMLALANQRLYTVSNTGVMIAQTFFRNTPVDAGDTLWVPSANVTVSLDSTEKISAITSLKIDVGSPVVAGATLAYRNITSTITLSTNEVITFWIRSSVTLAANTLQFLVDDSTSVSTPIATLNIPALTANTWVQVSLPFTTTGQTLGSIGIKQVTDVGAFIINIDEVRLQGESTITSNKADMITYKDRSLTDAVIIADGGRLKQFKTTRFETVPSYNPTQTEQTNQGLNDLDNLNKVVAIAIKKERIFMAGHPTVKNRLSFSHYDAKLGYGTYDYFPAPYFFDIGDEYDEIVDLKVFRNQLVVFCKYSIWALTGDGTSIVDYTLNKVNVPSGVISTSSIQVVGDNIFYLSNDHVYGLLSTDQNYIAAQIVSYNVEKSLQSQSLTNKAQAVATYQDNKYILSFPDGTALVFDNLFKSWTRWTNVRANSFVERDDILYFSSVNGYIFKFVPNTYNDDGVAVNFFMKTKNLDFRYPVQVKKLKRMWTIAKQYEAETSTFTLNLIADYIRLSDVDVPTDESGVFDEGDFDEVLFDFVDVVNKTHKFRTKARRLQVEISNNILSQPVTIKALVFQFKLKKPK